MRVQKKSISGLVGPEDSPELRLQSQHAFSLGKSTSPVSLKNNVKICFEQAIWSSAVPESSTTTPLKSHVE